MLLWALGQASPPRGNPRPSSPGSCDIPSPFSGCRHVTGAWDFSCGDADVFPSFPPPFSENRRPCRREFQGSDDFITSPCTVIAK